MTTSSFESTVTSVDRGPFPGTFKCTRCGNCCRHEGYVHLRLNETERIAAHLGMAIHDFTAKHTRLTADRLSLSLTEKADGSCSFLSDTNECSINAVKPQQCSDFPEEWRYHNFQEICKGIITE